MEQYLIYLIIATLTVASPGPGVILTLSNSIRYGVKSALFGVVGIALGIFIIAAVSATSLGILLSTSALAFSILKFIGAAYLVYLGIKLWRSPAANIDVDSSKVTKLENVVRFKEGFLISVLNPKPIFFFLSLFPQFINPEQSYLLQFTYLTVTFCGLILIVHSFYAVGASYIRSWLTSARGSKAVNRVGGSVFVLFGVGLASSQR